MTLRWKNVLEVTKSTALNLLKCAKSSGARGKSSDAAAAAATMPYVFISTQIRLESGPTICGDEHSDPELMEYLGAKLTKEFGNNFHEYSTKDLPRLVLNKLERRGYKVISQSGAGQTMIWTLHKPLGLTNGPLPNAEST